MKWKCDNYLLIMLDIPVVGEANLPESGKYALLMTVMYMLVL